MVSIPLQTRSDGIAIITIDLRESEPAPALAALRSGLRTAIEHAFGESSPATTAIVLRIIGDRDVPSIDPAAVLADQTTEQLTSATRELADQIARIEGLPLPSAAIVEGDVSGAGFEAALACGRRIMVRSPGARIGLPALSLGLLPAAGGVGRLLQRMPVRAAIDFLAKATVVDGPDARKLSLVDELADSPEAAEAMALAWLSDPARQAKASGTIDPAADPAASQAAAALAMAALLGRRRAAIALAAVASAWSTQDRTTAAATELRRAIELATHADTRAWLAGHWQGGEPVDQQPSPSPHGHGHGSEHPCPSRAAARIRAAGLLEAMALVGDGVPAARVEKLAGSVGMNPAPS